MTSPATAPAVTAAATLSDPDTPFAVVDVAKSRRNIDRLTRRLSGLAVPLCPHIKTAKCIDVANLIHGGTPGPITVSTLAEAEQFADAGYTNITYAVGIDPHKLPRVVALLQRGVALQVLLDSPEQAEAVRAAAADAGAAIPALIEVDCDGHRGGVTVDDPALVEIARTLHAADCFAGVLVHAGESYVEPTPAGKLHAVDTEGDVAVAAAENIRAEGINVGTVSVGSTPTAHAAEDLTGVTEVRAGNFVFFDLFMVGIGVCSLDDLALTVVTTVIGRRPEKGWILTDGGWMAMSRDRGTAKQAVDQGYGVVADIAGTVIPQLIVSGASQEHGILTTRDGSPLPDLPVGTRLRILPNHACATAAQHRGYQIIDSDLDTPGAAPRFRDSWNRVGGW